MQILLAPHEIGNQMQLIAEALRRRNHFATAVTFGQERYGYINDVHLNITNDGPIARHAKVWSFFLWAIQTYDIFHFHYGNSILSSRYMRHFDLPLLKSLGKKIFVHFRGSDIRNQEYFRYLEARAEGHAMSMPGLSLPWQRESLSKWRKYADGIFVSEPGLLDLVPEAIEIPQVLNLSAWKPASSMSDGDVFRIAHAPTRRFAKGTIFLKRAVSEMEARGCNVELVLIENVPAAKMKDLYSGCTIGVDQLLYGWYGKVSIELMALGIPVVCYIDDSLRKHRNFLPVASANPETLVDVLERLMEDSEYRQKLAERGLAYVQQYHDVERVADRLIEIYESKSAN